MNQPDNNLDNSKELISEYSISEASEQLRVPENTLRKYLNYFDLKVEKNKRKSFLSEETLKYLAEILQLKSNGLSLKQIKSLCEKQFNQKDLLSLNNSGEAETEQKINISENIENSENNIIPAAEIVSTENIIAELNPAIAKNDIIESPLRTIEINDNYFENINPNNTSSDEFVEILNKNNENKNYLNNHQNHHQNENLENQDYNQSENQHNEFHSDDNNSNWSSSQAPLQTFLTKDYVNKEIAAQGKRVSRLYRFLSSRNLPKDSAEIKADLDRRVIFLNGLRYFRDNWLERKEYSNNQDNQNHGNRQEQRGFLGV